MCFIYFKRMFCFINSLSMFELFFLFGVENILSYCFCTNGLGKFIENHKSITKDRGIASSKGKLRKENKKEKAPWHYDMAHRPDYNQDKANNNTMPDKVPWIQKETKAKNIFLMQYSWKKIK